MSAIPWDGDALTPFAERRTFVCSVQGFEFCTLQPQQTTFTTQQWHVLLHLCVDRDRPITAHVRHILDISHHNGVEQIVEQLMVFLELVQQLWQNGASAM